MLQANPQITTAAIWERLADQHSITVAYPTLRTYLTSRRAGQRLPGQDNDQDPRAGTNREAGK